LADKERDESSGAQIYLRDVVKTYDGTNRVQVLRNVGFRISAGEFVAVTGPSGSGKSTLLNILGLLDRPTSGAYWLDGERVDELSERERTRFRSQRLGFIFQGFHLVPRRTVSANVELALRCQGADRGPERSTRVAAVLDRVGLSHRADAEVQTLSGGERQRVAIARALVTRPSVLLCDEPTGNLDTETASQIVNLLGDLNDTGTTVVLITHDPHVASRASRQLQIVDGAVREESA